MTKYKCKYSTLWTKYIHQKLKVPCVLVLYYTNTIQLRTLDLNEWKLKKKLFIKKHFNN